MLGVSHGELEMGRGLSGAAGRNIEGSTEELAPLGGAAHTYH